MDKSTLKIAKSTIRQIAIRDCVTVEYVRSQMKIAIISGLCSEDPKIKAYWDSIPREGEVPTPEELIAHTSKVIHNKLKRYFD